MLIIGSYGTVFAGGFSARSFGMGGAFTGLADDVSAVLYNPAGINQSGVVGFKASGGLSTIDYNKFIKALGIADHMADGSLTVEELLKEFPQSANIKANAFGGANLKSLALTLNSENNLDLTKNESSASVINDTVSEGALTLGNTVLSPPMDIGSLSYGVNLKMINIARNQYSVDSAQKTVTKVDGSSYGLDVGVLAKVTDILTIGAQVDNLWVDDYKLKGTKEIYGFDGSDWGQTSSDSLNQQGDKLKRTMRVGASVQVPVVALTLAADVENFPLLTEGDQKMVYHYGIEKNILFNGISFRAGTYTQPEQNKDRFYTFGLGVNLLQAHINLGLGSDDGFKDSFNGVVSGNIKF
jgi:hypothetical protein